MHYKGSNKHSQEELEQIINELLDKDSEERIDEDFDSQLLSNLSDLARELYFSCDVQPEKENEAIDICKNLKKHLEEFSKNNKFSLK